MRERSGRYDTGLRGPLHCDTRALLKLYVPEPGSAEFNAIVENREDMMVSDLTVTEVVSAALHLALALSAGARSLVSFDARLAAAARAVGMTTSPP